MDEHIVVFHDLARRRNAGETLLRRVFVQLISAIREKSDQVFETKVETVEKPGIDLANHRRQMLLNCPRCAPKREELSALDVTLDERQAPERRQVIVQRNHGALDTRGLVPSHLDLGSRTLIVSRPDVRLSASRRSRALNRNRK